MAGPVLVASYYVTSATPNTNPLVTPPFTPSNGEVVIVKASTWDATIAMSTPTGGGQTYTLRVSSTGAGFRPWVGIWSAVISGSPGSMTVSSTPSANSQHDMVVERWSSAQLAVTPVTNSAQNGIGAAASSLTTSAADSVISWLAGDAQAVNPSGRVYLNSAVEEGLDDQHVSTNGVYYFAYQAVASAGATAYGLSAPTGMQWWIAGIEILAAGGGSSSISVGDAGSAAESLAVTATGPLADGGSAAQTLTVAAASPLADGGSAADTLAVTVAVPLADAGHGADAASDVASAPLADTAAAADTLAVAAVVALADSGAAADSASNGLGTSKSLTDAGSAADAITVVAVTPLADAGSAADAVDNGTGTPKPIGDGGSAADALTVTVTLALADTASAADSPATGSAVPLSDAGSAGQTFAATAIAALADGAAAADTLGITAILALTDAGSAADTGIGQDNAFVTRTLTDSGHGADALSFVPGLVTGRPGVTGDPVGAQVTGDPVTASVTGVY